jgi:hypothetical protein
MGDAEWHLAVDDGRKFLTAWRDTAGRLGWTAVHQRAPDEKSRHFDFADFKHGENDGGRSQGQALNSETGETAPLAFDAWDSTSHRHACRPQRSFFAIVTDGLPQSPDGREPKSYRRGFEIAKGPVQRRNTFFMTILLPRRPSKSRLDERAQRIAADRKHSGHRVGRGIDHRRGVADDVELAAIRSDG